MASHRGRRYPTSFLISVALHGSVALLLALVIVTQRESVPLMFSADIMAAPRPRAERHAVRHRRVPPLAAVGDTLLVDRPARSSVAMTVAPRDVLAPRTAVADAWEAGSGLVRPWEHLPSITIVVPVRSSDPKKLALRPEAALGDGRAADVLPMTPDEELPGLSSFLLGKVAPDDGLNLLAEYLAVVQEHIRRHQRYPRFARESGVEGTSAVRFTLSRRGAVSEVVLAGSSGFKMLDDAATEAIREGAPFPPFPDHQARDSVRIGVQIVFKLDDES